MRRRGSATTRLFGAGRSKVPMLEAQAAQRGRNRRTAADRGAGALLQRGSRRSPRWWPTSAPRCPTPPSTSTTTIRPTAPPRSAAAAGAVVRREPRQGKGHVVRRMFTDVEADIYVLVDGDATYDAPSAPEMIERLLRDRLDMVVAVRVDREEAAYRPGHRARQPAADRVRRSNVRRHLHRHAVGLSGVHAAVREVVSGAVGRLRDRDRAHHPRARA